MLMLNNNLKIFITVAELASVTEAAKKLYVSQPAISQCLKKLENELGVKLFVRNKRSKLALTRVGKEILGLAYQMTDLENKIYQTAYAENHMLEGSIRIASVPLGLAIIMAKVLRHFKESFPLVKVELIEGSPLEVKKMVQNFQVDLGISTSPYLNLEHKLLLKDRMVSINRTTAKSIDLNKRIENLIISRIAHDSICEQLGSRGLSLVNSVIVEQASTQINMLAGGNEDGIISELMLSTIPNKLVRGTVIPKIETEISLIAPNFNELTAAAREMVLMINDTVGQPFAENDEWIT